MASSSVYDELAREHLEKINEANAVINKGIEMLKQAERDYQNKIATLKVREEEILRDMQGEYEELDRKIEERKAELDVVNSTLPPINDSRARANTLPSMRSLGITEPALYSIGKKARHVQAWHLIRKPTDEAPIPRPAATRLQSEGPLGPSPTPMPRPAPEPKYEPEPCHAHTLPRPSLLMQDQYGSYFSSKWNDEQRYAAGSGSVTPPSSYHSASPENAEVDQDGDCQPEQVDPPTGGNGTKSSKAHTGYLNDPSISHEEMEARFFESSG